MSFRWLKHYMPRSLYGRAALILVMPVVVLQLVVSVAFLTNHLEDIITQMTRTVVREIQAVSQIAAEVDTPEAVLEQIAPVLPALQMQLEFIDAADVPLADSISTAVLTNEGPLPDVLNCVLSYERGEWDSVELPGIASDVIRSAYADAMTWANRSVATLSHMG